jgi:hypothetical protein
MTDCSAKKKAKVMIDISTFFVESFGPRCAMLWWLLDQSPPPTYPLLNSFTTYNYWHGATTLNRQQNKNSAASAVDWLYFLSFWPWHHCGGSFHSTQLHRLHVSPQKKKKKMGQHLSSHRDHLGTRVIILVGVCMILPRSTKRLGWVGCCFRGGNHCAV